MCLQIHVRDACIYNTWKHRCIYTYMNIMFENQKSAFYPMNGIELLLLNTNLYCVLLSFNAH